MPVQPAADRLETTACTRSPSRSGLAIREPGYRTFDGIRLSCQLPYSLLCAAEKQRTEQMPSWRASDATTIIDDTTRDCNVRGTPGRHAGRRGSGAFGAARFAPARSFAYDLRATSRDIRITVQYGAGVFYRVLLNYYSVWLWVVTSVPGSTPLAVR